MISKLLSSELSRFIITGLLAVSTDLLSYYVLIEHLPISAAKGTSFILGSIVAFFLNKIWTFNSEVKLSPAAMQFAILYALTLCANIFINQVTLVYILDSRLFSFLCATGTSTVLNYLGMKYWVFASDENKVSA